MSQSTEPSVVCVMLTNGRRDAMARQAVERFKAQTYQQKRLCIVNTGPGTLMDDETHEISEPCFIGADACTIGELRNFGNDAAEYRPFSTRKQPDILIHWDDDDLSHPNRIAEQVHLLQSSGADVCGYNECLFWWEGEPPRYGAISEFEPARLGEAWLYTSTNQNEAIGSSLCYWRKTWERKPFQPTSQGEDAAFQIGLKVACERSIIQDVNVHGKMVALQRTEPRFIFPDDQGKPLGNGSPRMLCRIHSGNTSNAYTAENMRAAEWQRVPEWDDYCRAEFSR